MRNECFYIYFSENQFYHPILSVTLYQNLSIEFIQNLEVDSFKIHHMKPANTNKKNNSAKKGFGFADAMFGIKDIAMEYQDLQGYPIHKQTIKPTNKINNTKINVIKKETLVQKKQAKVQMNYPPKETFKISSGKQFENFVISQLYATQQVEDVYELTIDNKLSSWQYNVFSDGIEAKMIVPQPQVSFNFDLVDVKQGGLGNCYFISTLASLAHLPKVLRQRIPKYKSYSGKDKTFQVNLFESGKNIRILVDNLFAKIFAKPVLNDISLMILEKAYAQAYGNFQIINMGHSCDSLRDMTGASSEYVDLKDKQLLTQRLQEIFTNKYPIVIASKTNVKMPFLSPKHSFNVLGHRVVNKKLYLKLRDPRGNNCSQFAVYQPITQEQSQNGIFWVDYPTLVENFEVITIAKVKVGNKYFYKTFKTKELSNNQGCILMTVKEKANFTITCHQKHKKFFDDKFTYQMLRVLVAKVEYKNGRITPVNIIGSDFKTQQVCSITADLSQGQYIIVGKIGLNQKPKIDNEALTMSIYTSAMKAESIQFEQVKGNVEVKQYLMMYIKNNKNQFKESVSDQKLYRYFGAVYGYLCVYYENKSKKSVIEQLQYNTENITISESKITLAPNQQKIILHKIGQGNNCSHKFAFKTKTIYKD